MIEPRRLNEIHYGFYPDNFTSWDFVDNTETPSKTGASMTNNNKDYNIGFSRRQMYNSSINLDKFKGIRNFTDCIKTLPNYCKVGGSGDNSYIAFYTIALI